MGAGRGVKRPRQRTRAGGRAGAAPSRPYAAPDTAPYPYPTVVPFQEVWSRSYCRARETLVDVLSEFPQEAEHLFKPPCVPLWRCGGCCGDEGLECVAVETRTIDLQVGGGGGCVSVRQVVRVSPILGTTRQEAMSFTEHTRCACRPRRKRLKNERYMGGAAGLGRGGGCQS
ncbi:hypothetical protein lerEdw1_009759 [Lerista edwardsae]|nr:hypothetical protein lerEdw1_009759 [Lerista edwardsae]